MKLSELFATFEKFIDSVITVNGWVLTTRTQRDIVFIKLNDGSTSDGIQLIAQTKIDNLDKINIGTSISATGKLIKSPAQGQPYELILSSIKIYGSCSLNDYPLAKGKLPLDYLRTFPHLRMRTVSFSSIFRIKSNINHATHLFFKDNKFHYINPNIISVNECEGGAGVFQLTEHDISDHSTLPTIKDTNKHDWSADHFDKPAYLTVSSQLQLEAIACSMGSVYTTNKSFRSEHSLTYKHVSEFEHLEIEDVFTTLDDLMNIAENYIKFVGKYLLDNNLSDIKSLGKFVSPGLEDKIKTIITTPFNRIKYNDAIKILQNATTLSKPVIFGEDLCSEFENYLTEYFKGPVFVSHWPIAIKSFYMKRTDDNILCENFDLLMPYKVGELIGGSIREDNLDKLLEVMKQKGVSPKPMEFYLDLRRFGTVPHGGFGLGIERLCMLFTGMENIKDTIAFPVFYKNCNY